MMNRIILVASILVMGLSSMGFSQVSDNFSDGDFTSNPVWSGDTAKFTVNADTALQSNGSPVDTDTLVLTTPNALIDSAEWRFYMKLDFNPTATGNYVKVYLVSDNPDLKGSLNGYFLRIGETGSSDTLELFRQTGTAETKILTGATAFGATTVVNIRVIRDQVGNWSLFADPAAGSSYNFEGTVNDATYTATNYFGVYCRYSTVSRFDQYYFDDFYIGPVITDTLPPAISQVIVTSDTTLDVVFSEVVEQTSAETKTNYSADNGLNTPASAMRDGTDSSTVHLEFSTSFGNGVTNILTVNGIADNYGNTITGNIESPFMYFVPETAERFDIVIDEIFPDPSPQVGLPEAEFVELYNNSAKIVDLSGYTLSDASSSTTLTSKVMMPGDYLILCANSDTGMYKFYGKALGVASWPSLNNSGDALSLRNAADVVIHELTYSDSWYGSDAKKEGGWTLEMIDPSNPCAEGSNWRASLKLNGGTPGSVNSVDANNPDTKAPELISADALDSMNVLLTFDEPLDSQSMATVSYTISPLLSIAADTLLTLKTIKLTLAEKLAPKVIYTISAAGLSDCLGNVTGAGSTADVILPEQGVPGDLIINEILFNPRTIGSEFIEIYNNSDRFIDLNGWYLTNATDFGDGNKYKAVTLQADIIRPGQYALLSKDTANIKQEYPLSSSAAFRQMSTLPSYNDDEGTAILINRVISYADSLADTLWLVSDSVAYTDDMQFSLLNDLNGVALERISFDRPSRDVTNWHSAAEAVGFATPGYQNSQRAFAGSQAGDVTVSPEVFSPDNDGVDDFVNISYSFESGGFVASVFIFDAKGRLVKELVENELLGAEGAWSWDGTLDNGEKGRVGIYVIYFEAFGLLGEIKQFKRACVLAGKL